MEPFETFEHAGLTVELHYDEDAGDPFTTMDQAAELRISPALARDYDYGETFGRMEDASSLAVAARYLTLVGGCLAAIPFRYDDYGSGGVRVHLTDTDDDRAAGFVVVTPQGIETTGAPDPEKAAREDFETWRQWIEGEVSGYVVKSRDGTVLDSCWGFYGDPDGDDGVKDEAKSAAKHHAHELALDIEPADVAEVLAELVR